MPEAIITYFQQPAKVNCDGNCRKAWGHNNRPTVQLSGDEDDYEYLADGELGMAPDDPGTYEGTDAKPADASEFPNRWCVRECERCNMSSPGKWREPLPVIDFSFRMRNMEAAQPEPKDK